MRRPEAVCSVGYPVPSPAVGRSGLCAYAATSGHLPHYGVQLIVEVTEAEPVINPIWWTWQPAARDGKGGAYRALLPDGEVGDLADITTRLRNGLATIGGTQCGRTARW